jgi:hypothetical protein
MSDPETEALTETGGDSAMHAEPAVPLSGALVPRSLDELQRFAKTVSQSRMVPKAFRGKPQDVTVAVMHGLEIGLRPLQALQNIAIINGQPSIYGDAALALVRRSGACEYVNEWHESTDQGLTAYAETKRNSEPEPAVRTFSEQDAKNAGLWGRKGPWSDYPQRMLQMRARSWLLRDIYPDVLQGLYIAEEAEAIPEGNGETVDPRGEMSKSKQASQQPARGREQPQKQVEAYGYTLTPQQAEKLKKRDDALMEREGQDLAAAIASVEGEMEDWPSDRLVSACDTMLKTHRERLQDQTDTSVKAEAQHGEREHPDAGTTKHQGDEKTDPRAHMDEPDEEAGTDSDTQDADEVKEAAESGDPEEDEPEEFEDADAELPF